MQLEQTLRTLCALPAVSGFEMQAAHTVAELFRPYCDTVDVDKNGNVIGSLSCGKEGAKTVLLDAHLDQIGFLVTEILDGGILAVCCRSAGVDRACARRRGDHSRGRARCTAWYPASRRTCCKAGEQNQGRTHSTRWRLTPVCSMPKAAFAWVRPSCSRSSRLSWRRSALQQVP